MKQFIEIPQDGESVLINVNHIAAIKSKSFGDKQICEIFVATPYQQKHWTVETGCLIIQSNYSIYHLRQLIEEAL